VLEEYPLSIANIRVTYDTNPDNARSESSIAVNPLDPENMVAGSKCFTNPSQYQFSLAVYSTFDGGQSWTEAAPLTLLPGWAGTSDPALSWDNQGYAYLVALPFGPGADAPLIGIAIYNQRMVAALGARLILSIKVKIGEEMTSNGQWEMVIQIVHITEMFMQLGTVEE
jgi:hypothetical protein